MPRHEANPVRRWLTNLALLALLAMGAMYLVKRQENLPGQTWRTGWVAGEKLRLTTDKRYEHAEWCYVCKDEILDSGTWAQLGEVISLVSERPGRAPRLMRVVVQDGERYLTDQGGAAATQFVLVQ